MYRPKLPLNKWRPTGEILIFLKKGGRIDTRFELKTTYSITMIIPVPNAQANRKLFI